jgi:hypothetical protein
MFLRRNGAHYRDPPGTGKVLCLHRCAAASGVMVRLERGRYGAGQSRKRNTWCIKSDHLPKVAKYSDYLLLVVEFCFH